MADIRLHQVGKTYANGAAALHGVSLAIAEGEFCVFVGPSGCGKSTLLRMIAGLEDITSGTLEIGGRRVNDLAPSERDVAMVFQNYALYPHLSVAANLGFGLRLAGLKRDEVTRRTTEVARLLQIDHLLDRLPQALSGGQRQRVAIGRALVRQPGVFLFDEPLSNLDAALRQQTRQEIARLHRQQPRACSVYVTHDQGEAMTLADRLVLLQPPAAGMLRPSVAQIGAPLALYHRPANLFAAGFLGSPRMNLLPAQVAGHTAAGLQLQLDAGGVLLQLPPLAAGVAMPAVGSAITLGVRAEHWQLQPPAAAASTALLAKVQWLEHLGDQSLAFLATPGGLNLALRLPPTVAPALGDALALQPDAAHAHLFGADGQSLAPASGPLFTPAA
ncbi:ABC transporter ATP-binding protein [Pseudaquabacterium pictum]|uniref:ABC transporter ATP-binding protein n=1 Tax=Pseudaquabacterium pictum TaxID=2315236 RepID=A0A480AVA2_9BURK|nr:ATP-binding cassette domain-containing protein [Rubrivivax pictus]GCL62708.1 ABC transporter ATP-binding protein [Rubrivivax pictus]